MKFKKIYFLPKFFLKFILIKFFYFNLFFKIKSS